MATISAGRNIMEHIRMIDEALVKSSHLRFDDRGPGGGAGGDGFDPGEEDQTPLEDKDSEDPNGAVDFFAVEMVEGPEGEDGEDGKARGGKEGDVTECTSLLLDDPDDDGDGDAVMGVPNDVMDGAGLCYDSVLLAALPSATERTVTHDSQAETTLGYAERYISSLDEREVLMSSSVPGPSSPSTYFQASNMHEADSTAVTGPWDSLHSAHTESDYCTAAPSSSYNGGSLGGGNSIEERAFVDSLCEEPLKSDCLDMGKASGLPDASYGNVPANNASQSSDPENEFSSALKTEEEDIARGDGEGAERNCNITPHQRKEKAPLGEVSLRNVLSDSVTGAFLDDAMVAMCGHSFGSGGLQRVLETHSCGSCGANILPNSLVPNFALRAAVAAYKHEHQIWQSSNSTKGTKRRRDQFQQVHDSEAKGMIARDQGASGEIVYAEGSSRPKGVQFPFAVNDRVLIKGNKRTPERFFGMEAVIASQCLNGWYLVTTLETGESVRLQYRSLQKLREMKLSSNPEAPLLVEEHEDANGSPRGGDPSDALKDYPSGITTMTTNKSACEYALESATTATDMRNDDMVPPPGISSSEGDHHPSDEIDQPHVPFQQSVVAGDAGSTPAHHDDTAPTTSFQEAGENMRPLEEFAATVDEKNGAAATIENLEEEAIGVEVATEPDAVPLQSEVGLYTSSAHDDYEDRPLLSSGLNHDNGAEVWRVGTSFGSAEPEPPVLLEAGQGPPPDAVSADNKCPVADSNDAVESQSMVTDKVNDGNEAALQTRSKRQAQHSKATSGSWSDSLQNSDPYRKVYTSGSRRRGFRGDSTEALSPDHVPVKESKPSSSLIKGANGSNKGSEKSSPPGVGVGTPGPGKQGKEMRSKSAGEILQIMRTEMLELEKQIPRNYLVRPCRGQRINWRKRLQASHRVSELGAQVRDLRYSVLLSAAGGMSDEEWDTRIARIIESEDVELLVSLWGRLYNDIYKWLECRLDVLRGRDMLQGRSPDDDTPPRSLQQQQDADGQKEAVSSVHLTTAATMAALDEVAEGRQDPDACIKALLASTMKLIQQQSRTELSAVREALEREKRHVTAKLTHLEDKFVSLNVDPPEPKRPADYDSSRFVPFASSQGYETDEGVSDTPLPRQDADGEATDLSDSD